MFVCINVALFEAIVPALQLFKHKTDGSRIEKEDATIE